MAVEEQRLRVRRSLEEKLGVEEASYLMDRPVGGWSDLVTNHTLDLKFRVLEERFDSIDNRFASIDDRFASIDQRFAALEARIAEEFRFADTRADERLNDRLTGLEHKMAARMDRGFRQQTWAVVTAVIAGMGVMAAIFGGLMLIAAG